MHQQARLPWMSAALIALISAVVAVGATLVIYALVDEGPTLPGPAATEPAATAQSVTAANQRAMSHGAGALNIPSGVVPAKSEAKVDAATHALTVRSLALQRQLEIQRGSGAARDNLASGTYAKDEAGVAALIGNP
jgi:hypothetical protein